MTNPTVSIVMSVFNGERFLAPAVESILAQTFDNFEFFIINDGSDDGSADILDFYQTRDSRVRVHHQQNRGLIWSLNLGCQRARGKYIARMDADDIAVDDRLMSQVQFLEAHPEIDVVGGAVEFIDANDKILLTARYPCSNREIQRKLLDGNALWHPTVLFRKTAFVSVGGYRNVADAEDYDMWLRMADQFQLANLSKVLLKYRVHSSQGSIVRCRKQALGTLAARSSAILRRSGSSDPLNSVAEITPALLVKMGVTEADLQTAMARGYLASVRNMCHSGEYSLALKMLEILDSGECELSQRWVVADLHLCAARAYWGNKRFFRGLVSVARAIVVRPIIVGRPIRGILDRASVSK